MQILGNLINNEAVAGRSERHATVYNPATGEPRLYVSLSSADETRDAIAAAQAAFDGWSKTPPLVRARVMFRFKELLEKRRDDVARLITSEHGKVFSDAQGEVTRGLEVVEFACGIPHLLKGEFSSNVGRDIDSNSLMQPLGVCAGITPFNFPAMVPLWMVTTAIAAGNAVILKPSERDPSAALWLAEAFSEAVEEGQDVPGHTRILVSDGMLDEFYVIAERVSKGERGAQEAVRAAREEPPPANSHLSLLAIVDCWHVLGIDPYRHLELAATPVFRMWIGVTQNLFRSPERVLAACQAGVYDVSFRADDLEFVVAARGWAQAVQFGGFDVYRRRFEMTRAFFEPRLAEANKVGAEMLRVVSMRN